jgi:hypothetical protein
VRKIRKASIIAAVLIGGIAAVAAPATAQAASVTVYRICNNNSTKCLQPQGNSTGTVNVVQQTQNTSNLFQLWLVSFSGDYLKWTNYGTKNATGVNKCLGVSGGSQQAIAATIQATCDGTSNQQWFQDGSVATNLRFKNRGSNNTYCLGIDGASKSNGARAMQFKCDGKVNQNWTLKKVIITETLAPR